MSSYCVSCRSETACLINCCCKGSSSNGRPQTQVTHDSYVYGSGSNLIVNRRMFQYVNSPSVCASVNALLKTSSILAPPSFDSKCTSLSNHCRIQNNTSIRAIRPWKALHHPKSTLSTLLHLYTQTGQQSIVSHITLHLHNAFVNHIFLFIELEEIFQPQIFQGTSQPGQGRCQYRGRPDKLPHHQRRRMGQSSPLHAVLRLEALRPR